jgi:hypothetical protein
MPTQILGHSHASVDAPSEPPQSFTCGALLSHILSFGAVRREARAGVLTELGAQLSDGDPINWELRKGCSA